MMTTATPAAPAATRYPGLVKALDDAAGDLQLFDLDHGFAGEPLIRDVRRRGQRGLPDQVVTLTLVEEDGVLYWRDRSSLPALSRRRSRRGGQLISGEIVTQRRFEMLAPDMVNASIQKLDDRFSAPRGLRKLVNGQWAPAVGPFKGTTLLLVHGTFSNNDHFLDEFKATLPGQQFLARAQQHYTQVLAFDHPTLAIGPLFNALELARLLAGSTHDVDVVAHSRGGLVTRWWLEALGGGVGPRARAVLVGSPIAGTSLAAGPRIRGGLDLLTNYGTVLERAMGLVGAANPFLAAPAAILRVLLSVTGLAAKLPIADAAVAMVPGLFAQARIGNNGEIARLRAGPALRAVDYFAVRSNFEPQSEGWKFWRYFRKTTLADPLADIVFDGENDLVVDTDSMTDFGASGAKLAATWDFKTNPDVHHVNYFRQPETIDFIAKSLQVP
jgi:pimeloyl-ACP methyl ester carboxylesterase